jgi:hypothetical protein
LKKSINIIPETIAGEENNWLMEISKAGIDVLFYTTHPLTINGLIKYEYNELELHEHLREYVGQIAAEDWNKMAFKNTDISFNFSEFILHPQQETTGDNIVELMDAGFGKNNAVKLLEEKVKSRGIDVFYRIDEELLAQCKKHYHHATMHSSTALQLSAVTVSATVLRLDVYSNFIKLILFKEDQLQTVLVKDYVSTNDVVFYMLQLCTLYSVNVLNVKIICTGMVTADGNLYLAINNYFSDVSMPGLAEEINIVPAMQDIAPSFYYNLVMLASCVS